MRSTANASCRVTRSMNASDTSTARRKRPTKPGTWCRATAANGHAPGSPAPNIRRVWYMSSSSARGPARIAPDAELKYL